MQIEETPINQGHKFADLAEKYEDLKQFEQAILYHKKAAECFEVAIKTTEDKEMQNTLRLLCENQTRLSEQSIIIENPENKNLAHKSSVTESMQFAGSFMLLKQLNELDVNDPFEKFWKDIEELVNKNADPMLIANCDFDEQANQNNATKTLDSDNDLDESLLESFFFIPNDYKIATDDCEIRKVNEKTDLKQENISLKKKVKELTTRVKHLEKILNENNTTLKSSIHQFKAEILQRYNKLQNSQVLNTSMMNSKCLKPNNNTNNINSLAVNNLNKSLKPMTQSHLVNNFVQDSSNKNALNRSIYMFNGLTKVSEINNNNIDRINSNNYKDPSIKIMELKNHIEKQEATIKKYKDRWAQLKLAAKTKRQNKQPINEESKT